MYSSLSPARTACTLKGGCLSIATQGSYWLSSPHPLALSTASRPGIPATAETSSRAGTRGRRVPASNEILQGHISRYGPVPGATRLGDGPREPRAGSRVPQRTPPGLSRLVASPKQLTANCRLPRRTLVPFVLSLQGPSKEHRQARPSRCLPHSRPREPLAR